MRDKIISVSGLTKSFSKVKAVDNFSLDVFRGEIFGLIGPNGAGKSTFVKLITGQLKPDKGDVELLDINVVKDSVRARSFVGIIPEQEVPPSFLNSVEYLNFVSSVRNLKNMSKSINFWFKFLGFENDKLKLSKDLSRGTRQKLMISQAFFFNPKIVIIDEPLVNLDPLMQKKMKDFIKTYAKKNNTVFLCTHVLSVAESICDRVGFIKNGQLIHLDSVKALVKKHGSLEKAFIKIVGT